MYLCDKPSIERRAIDEGSHESEPSHDLIIDFFILVLLQIKRETEREREYINSSADCLLTYMKRLEKCCCISSAFI